MVMKKNVMCLLIVVVGLSLVITQSCSKEAGDNTPVDNSIIFNPSLTYDSVTDIDGNVYKTITIGSQTWMAENLRTTHLNDGTPIPLVTAPAVWEASSTPGYCNYNNTEDTSIINIYGRLYNWYAVNTGKLSPTGWHVASQSDWVALIAFIGGADLAAYHLKEVGVRHWSSCSGSEINSTGFTALPAGCRYANGSYFHLHNYGWWWSTTEQYGFAWFVMLRYDQNPIFADYTPKNDGLSVRCVKD